MTWTSERILQQLKDCEAGQCITEQDLMTQTGFTAHQVDQACLKLRKHGLLEKSDQGCHTITDAGAAAIANNKVLRSGPNGMHTGKRKLSKNTLRIRVWRAIRIRQKFSIPELSMLVAEGGEKDITSNIGKYIRALNKAGYLTELAKRERGNAITSNGHKRYWLVPEMDTGPEAPVWMVSKQAVYDPNNEIEHSIAANKEEVATCG